jgi:hypothetical protein
MRLGLSNIVSMLFIVGISITVGYLTYSQTQELTNEELSHSHVSLNTETEKEQFTVKIIREFNMDKLILNNGLTEKNINATAGETATFSTYRNKISITGITDNGVKYYVTSYEPDISILGCQKYDSADNIPSVDVIHQNGQRVLYNVAKGESTNSVSNSLGEFEVDYTDSFDTTGVNVTHTYVDTDGDCQVELKLPVQTVVADETEFVIDFENAFSGSGYKADQDDKFFFHYEGVSYVGEDSSEEVVQIQFAGSTENSDTIQISDTIRVGD